jgi:hypothetical protein
MPTPSAATTGGRRNGCDVNGMDAIERVFREPNRMAILSVLCACARVAFTEQRDRCGLTDGTSAASSKRWKMRHCPALRLVDNKPSTTVTNTATVLNVSKCISTPREVLKRAKARCGASRRAGTCQPRGRHD